MIDPRSGRPKFRQVSEGLRQRIASGEWPAGHRLPSETELMKQYGVARVTARNAVRLLQTEGLVVTRQGTGSFVRGAEPAPPVRTDRPEPHAWFAAGPVPAPGPPADPAGLGGLGGLGVNGAHSASGANGNGTNGDGRSGPVVRVASVAPEADDEARVHESVWARMPTPDEAARLDITGTGMPVFEVTRRDGPTAPKAVMVLPADRVVLDYVIDLEV